jgi:hypothetical protein
MDTLSDYNLNTKRQVAKELVDELINSTVLCQSGARNSEFDINDVIQEELNELENTTEDVREELNELENATEDFIVADGSVEKVFILNDQTKLESIDMTTQEVITSEISEQQSINSLTSLDQQSQTHKKHVRFDESCDFHKQTMRHSNTYHVACFIGGFVVGLTASYLYFLKKR